MTTLISRRTKNTNIENRQLDVIECDYIIMTSAGVSLHLCRPDHVDLQVGTLGRVCCASLDRQSGLFESRSRHSGIGL